ncbi:MAG TPA: hypothetical protein VEA36_02070 [Candidatus Paceibacterota bacterium]|nr:hypothetical protein [Candidatus Paceibacterota bacterium]
MSELRRVPSGKCIVGEVNDTHGGLVATSEPCELMEALALARSFSKSFAHHVYLVLDHQDNIVLNVTARAA